LGLKVRRWERELTKIGEEMNEKGKKGKLIILK